MQAQRESVELAEPASAALGRLFVVAVLVALFAVGMSAFLTTTMPMMTTQRLRFMSVTTATTC